jgi:hypothetical protein
MSTDTALLQEILARLSRMETRLTRLMIHQGLNPYEKETKEVGITRLNASSRIPMSPQHEGPEEN